MKNIHKNINFFDPQITVKKKLVSGQFQYLPGTKMPLPSEVEISESGTCNRKCSFCPRSDPNYLDIKEFIKPSLHEKLHNELAELNFVGTVRYSGFVEPLLDKNIYNLLKKAKKINNKINLEMVTNGDVLNSARLTKLFKSGLDRLFISAYDGPDDVKKFEKFRSKSGLNKKQVVIRDRSLSSKEDFGLTISNRAGMLENAEYSIMPLKKKMKHPCYYPSYTFFMDYNGDVLMCAHDWGKKRILGNLNKSSFLDIWTSQLANISRKKLNSGNRGFSPCNVCDVHGTLIGEKHSKAWKEIL
jgi:radical SAM protein with 4Fe4S-binding SPASM domain